MHLKVLLNLVAFHHSIFALPFAFVSVVIAAGGWPPWRTVLLVTLAMVGGRTFGMAMNRLLDRDLDALNPRTRQRPLPRGQVTVTAVTVLAGLSAFIFLFSAFALNSLCGFLAPVVLAVLGLYPLAKRVTWASHLALGGCYFMVPVAAWLAVEPIVRPAAVVLGLAAATWVAGFDILYALQDVEFDRQHGVHSIPARFGVRAALWASAGLHLATLAALAVAGRMAGFGTISWAGLGVIGLLLIYEHRLVGPDDLSRISRAFFTVNGWVGVLLFFFVLADVACRR